MYTKRLFIILLTYIVVFTPSFSTPSPQVVAEGAILIEANTGAILYEKNALYPFYPASTTKVLTTLLLAESFDTDGIITKTQDSVNNVPSDSSHIGLKVGDSYSYKDGLHAILMGSDNFVSHDMAIYHSGSINAFSKAMNEKAVTVGAYKSHFTNPHGYHDANHYTTPFDLMVLTKLAFSNPIVEQIAGTATYNFTVLNTGEVIPLKHTAAFFNTASPYYNPHVVAAKTGYHTPAGRTLVAKAVYDDIELIAVVMRSGTPSFFQDINTLFNYGSTNFKASASEAGNYTLTNVSYAPWAKPYIDDARVKGYYVPNLQSYMDPITIQDFYTLLEKRLPTLAVDKPALVESQSAPSLLKSYLTPTTAQSILADITSNHGLILPHDFVTTSLVKVLDTVPTFLSTQDTLFLQQAFVGYFLLHYPPTLPPFPF